MTQLQTLPTDPWNWNTTPRERGKSLQLCLRLRFPPNTGDHSPDWAYLTKIMLPFLLTWARGLNLDLLHFSSCIRFVFYFPFVSSGLWAAGGQGWVWFFLESSNLLAQYLAPEQGLGEDLLNSDCKFPDSRGRGLHSWASSLGSAHNMCYLAWLPLESDGDYPNFQIRTLIASLYWALTRLQAQHISSCNLTKNLMQLTLWSPPFTDGGTEA